ncbi:MOSC domain-containing protein [Streptoalloteichus tenebrarius]|uniref:MOSC domain-containing protein n=1 Tax=Streptoalloteichus tenebrarius (strain ATCC 17920 / DSM 40477 / JCM 4838 / CBS 697.72 / NBRC 16177 / NCIMB 11028 / NRRL B-12390 / A12253. 1 / ISP 5477) TaxID=1933 RepID=UPI0020A5D7E4|nr:MOSC domain-containing protein [Streptoalloteichus tenebrarius]
MGLVVAVNVARTARSGSWAGRLGRTGIDKHPVDGPVRFTSHGVAGDTVCDRRDHGAWYQAAYAYDEDELAFWSQELGMDLRQGNAGENLTLRGVGCDDAVIGERWSVGSSVLRVTGPRTPCRVFAGFWGAHQFVRRFTERGRPGAYLAVETPGLVSAGDEVRVLDRPAHGVTVAELFAFTMRRRRELAERVAGALGDLPEKWAGEVAAKIIRS